MSLSPAAILEIEHLHSLWVAAEMAGDPQQLLALCDPTIELRPPTAPLVCGHAALAEYLALATARIHTVEIADLVITGGSHRASLTARFTTTFSTREDTTPRQISGHHSWLLARRPDSWLITRISWTL